MVQPGQELNETLCLQGTHVAGHLVHGKFSNYYLTIITYHCYYSITTI